MTRRLGALFGAALLLFCLAAPAQAALSTEYPETQPAEISISQQEIETLAARLEQVERDDTGCFEIIDGLSGEEEMRSADYTVSSLNVWNGVAYVSDADAALLDQVLADAGLADASDAEKLAWATEWIHNNLLYDGYHTGSYVYSCFEEAGGQCNIYNGALCALAAHLGYRVQLVRGYRGSTGSRTAHWWGELVTESGEVLVLETGNTVDGEWYFLGNTYEETHSSGRDYIKCNRYAYNGEPFEYLGAALYPGSPLLGQDAAELRAGVWKGADYTVEQVGLLFGEDPQALSELTSEPVDAVYNEANESRGFSVSYKTQDLGLTLTPGKTYYYAFFAQLSGGVRCTSETVSFTLDEAVQEEALAVSATADEGGSLLPYLAGGMLAVAVVVLLLASSRRHRGRRRRRRPAPARGGQPSGKAKPAGRTQPAGRKPPAKRRRNFKL